MVLTTPPSFTHPATPAQLAWLGGEVAAWRAEGLVAADQATAILGRYHPSRRFTLARLLLGLGAAFVGVGVIWLVAANLDGLPPLGRFLLVAALWLVFLVGAETLAVRRSAGAAVPSPVVGAVRILAVLVYGAVVFQAAQSLQVPAYEPLLLGLWSAGALLHAYTVGATGPLVVGLLAGAGWVVWQSVWQGPSPLAATLTVLAAGAAAAGVAVLQDRWRPAFGAAWREVGAVLSLGGLFVAAIPSVTREEFVTTPFLVAFLGVAGAAVVAGTIAASGPARLEPLAALAMVAAGVLLVLWDAGDDPSSVTAADWAHAGLSVTVYVAAALWVAVLGIRRDSWRLTGTAVAAVVVFTTFQSFAVFAQIIQGAWLFVLLGVVLLGTGVAFERVRRGLAATLEGESR